MSLLEQNKIRWQNCKVPADKGPSFASVAARIKANKEVYDELEKETGVPWWFIGMVHYRESNLDMTTNIANGQRFNKKTTIVPKGRGPFGSFKEAAIDALVNCAPHAAKNKDWTAAGALTKFEEYNGLGYAGKGVPSPYVWAGTDQYIKGKYIADHVYDPEHVDTQLGGAGILKFLGVFNKGSAGGAIAAGTVVAAGAGAAVTAPTNYLPWIVGGTFALALIAFLVVDIISFRKWKKEQPNAPIN